MNRGTLIIADSEACADLLYATGFTAPDPFVYFSVDGKIKGIVVTALELKRAKAEAKKGITVFDRDDIMSKECPKKDLVAVIKGIIEKYPVDCWDLPENFPLVYAEYLKSIGVKYSCVEGALFPERRTKNAEEMVHLRESMKTTQKAMFRAESILREAVIQADDTLHWQGRVLTSEIIRREINIEAIKGDAIAACTIVACGEHSSEPHNCGTGVISANKPIVIDIFPRNTINGYWGDMTRTFVKGKAPQIVKDAYSAVKDARDLAKEEMKAGISASELYDMTLKYLETRGFKTGKSKDGSYFGFFHGLGHGLGLEIHERPFARALNDIPLKVNDVITVEPGVYYPEWGGIRLEDLVVVKEDGIECLTDYPNELEIE